MAIDTAALGRSWSVACDDAGIATPAEARLYYLPGEMVDFQGAFYLDPGTDAVREPSFPFSGSQVADANAPEHRSLHRIAVRDLPDEPIAVALLRHELEHARQHHKSIATYRLMGVSVDTLAIAIDQANPPSLTGSAVLYNFLPHELDANRAAAACVRRVFDEEVVNEHASGVAFGQLFRETVPPNRDTLADRLTAVCGLFPAAAEKAAVASGGIDGAIRQLNVPYLSRWWSEVRPAAGLDAVAARALDAIPTVADVTSAAKPPDAWGPTLAVLREGLDLAIASIAEMST